MQHSSTSVEGIADGGNHADAGLQVDGGQWGSYHTIDKLPVLAGQRQLVAFTTGGVGPAGVSGGQRGTLDRGAGFNQEKRNKLKERSLVDTGKHAGRSRVKFKGISKSRLLWHYLRKDFFITVIEVQLQYLILLFCAMYLALFFLWSLIWYIQWRVDETCFSASITGFVSLFIFSTYTQQTIGYGNYFPTRCMSAAWLLILQSVTDILLDAIMLGVLYSRISHPKQRGRSIFISDSACISRRDSILKFMFRVADVQKTQVVDPKVKAYLYTWGHGRRTAEGEVIPVRVEALDLPSIVGRMVLPLIVDHTIDEKSPLFGHTHDSLVALGAEIVITFEGSTEFGNPFMARQSYLPNEVYWGYQFVNIIYRPLEGQTRYRVDISRFHEIQAQTDLPKLPPSALSKLVVSRALPVVPAPLLGHNTLVISSCAVVHKMQGQLYLSFRVGDTYGYQVVEAHARAYLYRWADDERDRLLDYSCDLLDVGYGDGSERLFLRLPTLVHHKIDDKSPLKNWLLPGGILEDADSELTLLVEGYRYVDGDNLMRQRTYSVFNQVRIGHEFAPVVERHASLGPAVPGGGAGKGTINWSRFDATVEVDGAALLGLEEGQLESQTTPEKQIPPVAESEGGDIYDEELTVRSRRDLERHAGGSRSGPSTSAKRSVHSARSQLARGANPTLERYASTLVSRNISIGSAAAHSGDDTTDAQDTYMTT